MEASNNSVTNYSDFGEPFLVDTIINEKSIELIYKENSNYAYFTYPPMVDQRVFKIIFSCKNGKWHKSERIYGEIIPASDETFIF